MFVPWAGKASQQWWLPVWRLVLKTCIGIYDVPCVVFSDNHSRARKTSWSKPGYILQNMLVKDIKFCFFANAAALKYFISLDLEKVKTNLASERILQACFPSMCSSGCFILLFSLWFILIKLHSLSDSLPVKHLREIIWWWSWDHLGGRGFTGTWALEQG